MTTMANAGFQRALLHLHTRYLSRQRRSDGLRSEPCSCRRHPVCSSNYEPSSNSSGLRALLMDAQSEGTFASFEELPYELFTAVLCYLPVKSLGALSCTSKIWKERVECCVDAWKYHFVAFFGNTPRNKKTEEGHRSLDNLPWRPFTISEISTMRSKKNSTTLLFWGTIKG